MKKWLSRLVLSLMGLTLSSCALPRAVSLPHLAAENAGAGINEQIVVIARLKQVVGSHSIGGRRLQTYLWRDDRWAPMAVVMTDSHGQARLTLQPGALPKAGKYFIGWKLSDDGEHNAPLSVSTVTVTP